ncbi:MAG: tetratricopeptide repeat protein [Rickettsiales bacterium]
MKTVQKNKTIEDFFAEADVHDVGREANGGILTFIVAFVLLIVESLLVYWAVSGSLSLNFVLILHAIVVVLLTIYATVLMKSGKENRFALLLMLTTATAGPYGAGGVMFAVILYFLFVRRSVSFDEWYDTIFPSVTRSQSQRVYDDIVVGRDESSKSYSVIPFLDVLSFGDELQKRQALSKMTSSFHPNFAPAFKKALSDDSNTIRVQAATAITKIENMFMERLMKLTRLKDQYDQEPVVVMALAEHYDNYAYTGLLDADREQANRKRALVHYQEYLQLDPNNLDVRTRIGRILMREKDYERACEWFAECIKTGHNSESISQWYCEALFNCGRFDDLRRFSGSYTPSSKEGAATQPLPVKEALALWSGAGGEA